MGLDMYLERHKYIGANYEHRNIKGTINITEGKDNTPIPVDLSKVVTIIESVAYWRKANAIHKWFVDNTQYGEDQNGVDSYVSREQLKELVGVCKEVLQAPEGLAFEQMAVTKLPPVSGFFFGSTNIDEWYKRDLEYTVEVIEEALKDKSGEFYYHSSW